MSQLTLVIGNKKYSSWSLRPWFWMKQHGIEFKERRIALYTENSHAQMADYYSNDKVPVLLDDDFIVWDSLAILEYLAEKFPLFKGLPDDSKDRAMARSMCAEMHSSFDALRTELPMNCQAMVADVVVSEAVEKDIERIGALWRYFRKRYHSRGPWLFGEFSIVDAMFAPVVIRFQSYGLLRNGLLKSGLLKAEEEERAILLGTIEQQYCEHILAQESIIQWCQAGKEESEIVPMFEVGQ